MVRACVVEFEGRFDVDDLRERLESLGAELDDVGRIVVSTSYRLAWIAAYLAKSLATDSGPWKVKVQLMN